jgi:hypothetical protein
MIWLFIHYKIKNAFEYFKINYIKGFSAALFIAAFMNFMCILFVANNESETLSFFIIKLICIFFGIMFYVEGNDIQKWLNTKVEKMGKEYESFKQTQRR